MHQKGKSIIASKIQLSFVFVYKNLNVWMSSVFSSLSIFQESARSMLLNVAPSLLVRID